MQTAPTPAALQSLDGASQKLTVVGWLKDPYLPAADPGLASFHAAGVASEAMGALGFYLFAQAAERWQSHKRALDDGRVARALLKEAMDQEKAAADRFLTHPSTLAFIKELYDLPDRFLGALSLHRAGTTSYILIDEISPEQSSSNERERLALKLIKPRFHGAQTIRDQTITVYHHTAKLHFPFVPTVKGAPPGATYIAMNFIEGDTLREAVAKRRGTPEFVTWAQGILQIVCSHLGAIHRKHESHLDLSPENIIIADSGAEKVYLIDFGKNHLLVERVGPGSSYLQARRYIAPELETDADSLTADVYSLGVILIENIAQHKTDSSDLEIQLDVIRAVYPRLALILESMVDPNPETRAVEFRRDAQVDYDELYAQVSVAMTHFRERGAERLPIVRALGAAFSLVFPNLDRLVSRFSELERRPGQTDADRDTYRLACWGVWNEAMHLFLVLIASYVFKRHYDAGTLATNLPGLIVALSFTFVATKYYGNIFAEVSARRVAPMVDKVMRFNSFSYFVPIAWTLVVDPADWPFCSAAGMAIVTLNNWMAWKLAVKAGLEIDARPLTRVPQSHFTFVGTQYGTWWQYTAIHTVLLFLTGWLLSSGRLHDEWAYAVIVVVVNVLMFYYNDIKQAAAVRSGLSWAYDNLHRLRQIEKHRVASGQ